MTAEELRNIEASTEYGTESKLVLRNKLKLTTEHIKECHKLMVQVAVMSDWEMAIEGPKIAKKIYEFLIKFRGTPTDAA